MIKNNLLSNVKIQHESHTVKERKTQPSDVTASLIAEQVGEGNFTTFKKELIPLIWHQDPRQRPPRARLPSSRWL